MARIALALVGLALVLATVPWTTPALPAGGMFGGDLRVALQAAPSLDPFQVEANRIVQELAYDSLTRVSTERRAVPWLAASWTENPGAGQIQVTLRSDATWPDGAAITAQDVAWTYGKYLGAGTASGFTLSTAGATGLTFTFSSGGGDFLTRTATLPIAWRNGGDAPESNGPFLVDVQSGSEVSLVANEAHWNGRPFLDRTTFRFPFTMQLDATGNTTATDAGCAFMFRDVDLIGWPLKDTDFTTERDCTLRWGGFPDDPGTNDTDESRRSLIHTKPGKTVPHSGSADNPGLRVLLVGMNTQQGALADPIVRQALSRAVDRDLISTNIESGTDIADSLISPANLWWFNANVPKYRVPLVLVGGSPVPTLEGVNAFLDENGYLLGNDGVRRTPGGQALEFRFLTYDTASDARFAKYDDLARKFSAIGIRLNWTQTTPAALRNLVDAGTYDLFVDIFEVGGDPSFLFDLLHSTGSRNVVNLASPALDALLESARDAVAPTTHRQAVLDAQSWISDNVPLAPIVHYRARHAHDRLAYEGWVHGLGGIVNFWTFTSVHVAQRGPLVVRADALRPSLKSGETTTIRVQVLDRSDLGVAGVSLELDGPGVAERNGTTDGQGIFEVVMTAPPVTASTELAITVLAAKEGYAGASDVAAVTVHPSRGLLVTLDRGSVSLGPGEQTFVRVTVNDAGTALPVANATVTLTLSPTDLGGSLASSTGATNAQGLFETSFSGNVAVTTRFLITARVDAGGYDPQTLTTSLEVTPESGRVPEAPGLDVVSMVAVVALLAAIFGYRQRRRWKAEPPHPKE